MDQKKFKIGILGAGQLGCLLGQAAIKRGIPWTIFSTDATEPSWWLFPEQTQALSSDPITRQQQLKECETILLENEFSAPAELAQIQTKFLPTLELYRNFYGKISQRLFYQSLNLRQPPFWIVETAQDLERITHFPVMLKRNLLSYDGYGNREASNRDELLHFSQELGLPLLVEKKVKLKQEFAVGLVGDGKKLVELPLVETVQEKHICRFVIGPMILSEKIQHQLSEEISKLKKAKLHGLFAFEFFITQDDELFINEGAARPHNSQHLTQNLCNTSQFDYLVALALGELLPAPTLLAPEGAMINLLGTTDRENPSLELPIIAGDFPYTVYLYGKKHGRVGRKMAHMNVLNPQQRADFREKLQDIAKGYTL